jgi:hypothetical protein
MEAVKEVTVWAVEYRQPNHTYLMDGDKAVAYIRWHEGEPFYFKVPSKLDKRYRKFEKVDISVFGSIVKEQKSHIVEVKGSKGNSYFVDKEEGRCTCPGFQFRGTCKHVKETQ